MNLHTPDPFEPHRRRLAGEKLPVHDGKPEPGWYKTREKTDGKYGAWLPASIFLTGDGSLVAEIDGREVDPVESWTRLAKNPVSEADYRHRSERGFWPDEPAPTGHNQPPESTSDKPSVADDDPELSAFLKTVEGERETARQTYADLTAEAPKAIADRAQNVLDRLRKLSKQIDDLRIERKRPYLEAVRAIDEYFREPVALPLTIADKLASRIKAWRAAERERRRQEAIAEAARIAEEQRKAREAMDEAGADDSAPVAAPEPAVKVEPVLLGGGVGRRSGGRVVVTAKIVDQDAVYQHFREHADVVAMLQRLANAAIKKQPVPGAERFEEERV